MKIILMEKVVNLGNLGDIVSVKDGYARNFLVPAGRAKRATAKNLEEFAARKAEIEQKAAEALAAAQARAAALEGFMLSLTQKAGVDGRLFGSITNADIAEGLKAAGHAVAKAEVRMPDGPLKALGIFTVALSLHTDVALEIGVTIQPE